jgi:hypothetical protein
MARAPWLAALAGASTGSYWLASRLTGYTGFPLDDAWIHQTFARNLALRGEWSFVPGTPAAGSTSPLWTGLLALGYWLGVDHRAWAYLWGGLSLALAAWLAARLAARLRASQWAAAMAGALVALEWHLAWASASGMETLLFSALALYACGNMIEPDSGRGVVLTGTAIGLAVLARPDGLTLLPFAALAVGLGGWRCGWRAVAARLALLGLSAGAILAGYLAFNFFLSGAIWPTTFYAKQAEYASALAQPLTVRLWQTYSAPCIGPLVVLAPGLVVFIRRAGAKRWVAGLLPLAWVAAFLLAYALRLPLIYQHGRYLMPAIPVLAACGVAGCAGWSEPGSRKPGRRILSRAWILALAMVTAAFWLIGARRYATDVAIIETEMVATARWLRAYTPPQALIAVHDIGAVGYFAERPVLDLAGLVSPQVIPILRDEAALLRLMLDSGARYFVTFPGWYPSIVADKRITLVYRTGGQFSPRDGGENMSVYRVAPISAGVLYSHSPRFGPENNR